MQTRVESGPRRTKYDDLNEHLKRVHHDWHEMLIDIRETIESGSRMRAWFDATYIARIAEDMLKDADGDLAESARHLRDAAMFLVNLAKNGP